MEIIILDCRRLTGREEAHAYLARTLRLPPYYGRNLDALADCLGMFGEDIYIVLQHAAALRQSEDDYGSRILEVFREMAAIPAAFTLIEKE